MKKNMKIIIILAFSIMSCNIRVSAKNQNIVEAYTYDITTCITGEEPTCKETKCYESNESSSCPSGTIIQYKVNNTTTKYFYVLHDDGETLTLQQRENTVYFYPWSSKEDYLANGGTKEVYDEGVATDIGPITILREIEKATEDWTNVNIQNYTLGKTKFLGNEHTSCTYAYHKDEFDEACEKNSYTMPSRTARARIISFQEANALGCIGVSKTCPIWMYNYLWRSKEFGGTVDDDSDYHIPGTNEGQYKNLGYWTLSSYFSTLDEENSINYNAHFIGIDGKMTDRPTAAYYINIGGRAVIVVNKEENPKTVPNKKEIKETKTISIPDTFRNAYVGYCLGTIILILGIVVIIQTYRKIKQK